MNISNATEGLLRMDRIRRVVMRDTKKRKVKTRSSLGGFVENASYWEGCDEIYKEEEGVALDFNQEEIVLFLIIIVSKFTQVYVF